MNFSWKRFLFNIPLSIGLAILLLPSLEGFGVFDLPLIFLTPLFVVAFSAWKEFSAAKERDLRTFMQIAIYGVAVFVVSVAAAYYGVYMLIVLSCAIGFAYCGLF